jgi:predicted phosphodiesterase
VRIAVISDIHAAHQPFVRALADARSIGFDQLILLGDLFTYGLEPCECAETAAETIAKDGALLIGGNHDQLYLDLERQENGYYLKLPSWIRESVDWTWLMLGEAWPKSLPCIAEWQSGDLFMAHANPFGYGDWTYLSNKAALDKAADICAKRGFRHGVFGHLHRDHHHVTPNAEIHVVGSIGQPRSRDDPAPHWNMIDVTRDHFSLVRHDVEFDAAAHCAAIRRHPAFSTDTKQQLCGFFE